MSQNLVKLSRGGSKPPPPANADGGISITAAAAEEIKRQGERRGMPGAAVRLGVRGGGCSGYSYLFDWEAGEPRARDQVFSEHGVRVYVDPRSLRLLAGTELDFVRSLTGHGFKFNNPNAKGSCGCGESIQF